MTKKDLTRQNLIIRATSFFLLIFFIVFGIIILAMAQGTRFDFTNRELLSTGSIEVHTNHDEFTIKINDEEKKLKENRVENLEPGEYTLTISRNGYSEWTGKVVVSSGIITPVNVRLFKNSITLERVYENPISGFYFNNNTKYIVLTEDNVDNTKTFIRQTLEENDIFNIQTSTLRLASITSQDIDSISISNDYDKFIINDSQVLSAKKFNEAQDITDLPTRFDIYSTQWLKNDENILISADNILLDYEIESDTYYLINYFPNLNRPRYFLDANISTVYYIQENILYSYKNHKSEAVAAAEISTVVDKSNLTTIHTANDDKLIVSNTNEIYLLDLAENAVHFIGNYKFISANNDGSQLIVKDANNLYKHVLISKLNNLTNIKINDTFIPDSIKEESITWANDSTFFVFNNTDSEGKVLYVSDNFGNNIRELLNLEVEEFAEKIFIAGDNTYIILQLKEESGKEYLHKITL